MKTNGPLTLSSIVAFPLDALGAACPAFLIRQIKRSIFINGETDVPYEPSADDLMLDLRADK